MSEEPKAENLYTLQYYFLSGDVYISFPGGAPTGSNSELILEKVNE